MPPATETAPPKTAPPTHRAITGYDDAPARALQARHNEIVDEIADTEKLDEQLQVDVAALTKKTKFSDKKALEILSLKRIQAGMVPGKLGELQDSLTQTEEAISVELGKLTAATSKLLTHDYNRILAEISAVFRPACADDAEALELAGKTRRAMDCSARSFYHAFSDQPKRSLDKGLALLDEWNANGEIAAPKIDRDAWAKQAKRSLNG